MDHEGRKMLNELQWQVVQLGGLLLLCVSYFFCWKEMRFYKRLAKFDEGEKAKALDQLQVWFKSHCTHNIDLLRALKVDPASEIVTDNQFTLTTLEELFPPKTD